MKTIEESVVTSMDGTGEELFPFLPYILQDFWEIGSSPEVIINLMKKHISDPTALNVLDAGCGKGAVTINIARSLGCNCIGVDAIKEFIEYARDKAQQLNVQSLCRFKHGDLRVILSSLKGFDIIILGSVGSFMGNYRETLGSLKESLNANGMIILDDAYIEDERNYSHPVILKKSEMIKCIHEAGLMIKDEHIHTSDISDQYDSELGMLEARCLELIKKHPEKSHIFYNYIENQKREYEVLKSKVINSCLILIKTKS